MRWRRSFAAAACVAVMSACSEPAPQQEAVDPDEIERLRALGYAHVVDPEDENGSEGVVLRDAERMQPGLTYFTEVSTCTSRLVDEEGAELARWSLRPCEVWGNTILRPDGSVLAVHQDPHDTEVADEVLAARRLLHLDRAGKLLWSREIGVHHDVDVMPDGRIAALTYGYRVIPEIHPQVPVRDHFLAEIDPDGTLLRETSLTDLMLASAPASLQPVAVKEKEGRVQIDLIHSNSLEFLREPELAARNPRLYAPTHVLLCLRHQDLVMLVDWPGREIVWAWGQGRISGPHDATLLANGNVLIFDNGLGRRWSRVIEVDPRTDRIVWEYRAPEPQSFYTITRGASQRLANGNTLVTYSRNGSIFEVTPAGDRVWEYRVPRGDDGEPRSRIVRARRLPRPAPGEPFAVVD